MKIHFLTEQKYQNFIEEHEGYIFRNIRFNQSLDQSEAFLAQAPIESLEEKMYEVWVSDELVHTKIREGMLVFETKGLTYTRFESLEEGSLEDTAYEIYTRIFAFSQKTGLHIARIWNYIPRILDEHGGLERYRQFNKGRSRAWDEHGPKNTQGQNEVTAATGIGALGGGLRVGVIFSQEKPIHIQNPRQVNAFHYSEKYGPRPPMFSCATYLPSLGIFVSGTASIIGEDVVHIDNLQEQVEEAIENIKILVSDENLARYQIPDHDVFSRLTGWRIYVKDGNQKELVLNQVHQLTPAQREEDKILLRDNICRKDLLVEMECNYFKE